MRLLLDGYNVIFAPMAHRFEARDSEGARQQLLSLLAAYRAVTQDTITVAFDGHPGARMYPETQNVHGIIVIYSEADADADAVIKRLIARDTNPRDLTVVSSDHSILSHAKRFRCKCMESAAFLRKVNETFKAARTRRGDVEPIEKYEGLSPAAAEHWMKVLGLEKKA